jgi:Winged helix DNA-binding domain
LGAVRISVAERRTRLGVRHHLTAPGDDVVAAVRALVALHATDPSTVHLSTWARVRGTTPDALATALYEDRRLVRLLGMRRTMFVVPVELVPVVQAACTRAIAVVERRKTEGFVLQHDPDRDAAAFLREVEAEALAALEEAEGLSTELSARVPRLAERITFRVGNSPLGSQSVASRVLPQLAMDGLAVRGRPRGTWTSGQYQWSAMTAWLPDGVAFLEAEPARTALAAAWLRTFGPAPLADLKWWSGWTVGQTKAALAGLDVAEVDLDGVAGVALTDDLAPTPPPDPYAALLPALDPTVMGWKTRDWFLGGHGPALFDTNGNAGPTVWWDGRVVGGWAQRRTGEVVVRLLEDVGADAAAAIEDRRAALEEWIGPVRVTPRFRTPLERELTA